MNRRTHRVGIVVLTTLLVLLAAANPASAITHRSASSSLGTETSKMEVASYVLVDADTGNVLDAKNEHANLPPASITKLLTALVATSHLSRDEEVGISATAASMPAMKIDAKEGQVWKFDDLLHSLLMISANDAAVAVAEASGKDLAGFAAQREEAARELGLQDHPIFNDPAGLDDTQSNDGGDLVSARDMAIIARADLADPTIRQIVGTQKYSFTGPDGHVHKLTNHNQLLARYPGLIGMKTGYTKKAKQTFVGAALRDGRTMIAVTMGGNDPYAMATSLLDKGFTTPVASESPVGALPSAHVSPKPDPNNVAHVSTKSRTSSGAGKAVLVSLGVVGVVAVVLALALGRKMRVDPVFRAKVSSRVRQRWNGRYEPEPPSDEDVSDEVEDETSWRAPTPV